ncbi:MAG: hypothetical protein U0441_39110 [Polyangiaceae bacterium]
MKSSSPADSAARTPRALAILSLAFAALWAAGCSGNVASGGDGGSTASGGGGSTAPGGSGGSTVTETHGCPEYITSDMPCYDPGLACGNSTPDYCGSGSMYWECYSWSDVWQYAHWDTAPCTCPDTLPTEGSPCSTLVDSSGCNYDVMADCGPAKVLAVCDPWIAGEKNTWKLNAPTCQ